MQNPYNAPARAANSGLKNSAKTRQASALRNIVLSPACFVPGATLGLLTSAILRIGSEELSERLTANPAEASRELVLIVLTAFALTAVYRFPRWCLLGNHDAGPTARVIAAALITGIVFSIVDYLIFHRIVHGSSFIEFRWPIQLCFAVLFAITTVETEAALEKCICRCLRAS